MKLSEKRNIEKHKKFEKELRSELAKWNSARLKKATSNFVHYLNNEGTPRDFVNFILATKFGGQNALAALGVWKEFVIESFNQAWKLQEVKPNDHGFRASYIYRPSNYGHAFVEYAVEEQYSSLMAKIDLSDYRQAINISHNLFLENSTQAFGFVVIPYVLSHDEMLTWRQDRLGELNDAPLANVHWQIEEPPTWKPSNEFSSGKLEYTSGFQFIFGSLKTLVEHLPSREKINVREYIAKRGGKNTTISSHNKRKPIRRARTQEIISNHLVYKVYDHKDKLRYIGEGLPNRPDHVFSGASHNPKINEHFFTQKKPMRIEIFKSGLTKSDALAMERLLLLQHRKDNLWNTKDYHPDTELTTKSISDEAILDMIDSLDC